MFYKHALSSLIKHLTNLEIKGLVLSNNKSYKSTRIVMKAVLPREIGLHSSIVVHWLPKYKPVFPQVFLVSLKRFEKMLH